MILEIQHETRLHYTTPVAEWLTEMRVEPVSDADQSCQTFFLGVSQPAPVHRFTDGFGNRVHHFNLLSPHLEVRLVAASVVETHPTPKNLSSSTATLPLDPETLPLETLDFVSFHGPIRHTSRLEPVLNHLRPSPNARIAAVAVAVMLYLNGSFAYAKAVTDASSPIADVLASIPVPEHAPTFWADLHKRLDAETAVRRDEQVGATVTSIGPAAAAGSAASPATKVRGSSSSASS